MSHQLVTVISISKDCSTFIFRVEQTLRKVGNYLPGNMAKQSWKLQSEELLATFIKSVLEYFIDTGSCKNTTLFSKSLNIHAGNKQNLSTHFQCFQVESYNGWGMTLHSTLIKSKWRCMCTQIIIKPSTRLFDCYIIDSLHTHSRKSPICMLYLPWRCQ